MNPDPPELPDSQADLRARLLAASLAWLVCAPDDKPHFEAALDGIRAEIQRLNFQYWSASELDSQPINAANASSFSIKPMGHSCGSGPSVSDIFGCGAVS